jgi:type IV secretion system protein VirB4
LAVGGTCYEPGNEAAPVAFQPLGGIDKPAERVWAAQFVATLLAAQGALVDHRTQSAIDETLLSLASAPRNERTLTLLATQIGSRQRALRDALRPYTLEGNYGQIFDADKDSVEASGFWTNIEMGHLMAMGPAVVLPALEYLFHRVEGRFDGRPTLLILDEAWLFLSHAIFATRLQAWLKTLRKKNVYVVFATQEVADATSKPELLSTILSACHTKIFLPDEEATTPAMAAAYHAIGLTTAEIDILAKAQKKRDYYYRSVKGRRLFELGLGPAALAFVGASSENDQRFLDELVVTRAARDYARAMLERRGVSWAAAELSKPAAPAEPSRADLEAVGVPSDLAPPRGAPPPDAETVCLPMFALQDLLASEGTGSDAVTAAIPPAALARRAAQLQPELRLTSDAETVPMWMATLRERALSEVDESDALTVPLAPPRPAPVRRWRKRAP